MVNHMVSALKYLSILNKRKLASKPASGDQANVTNHDINAMLNPAKMN